MIPLGLRAAPPASGSAILRKVVLVLGQRLRAMLPTLLYGIRLWVAVCLALFLSFWLELDNPFWAGVTAAIVCQPAVGASVRKGWYRMLGTVIGALAAIALSALFPQSPAAFLLSLALWGSICALVATLLRNFASYAASLAGFTAAIIVGDELGDVGGLNGDAFNLAVARSTEIGLGIVCAGLVLTMTDFGDARQRLTTLLADLSADIARGFIRALQLIGSSQVQTRLPRRRLIGRVAGLDTVIDQAIGEIAGTPFRPRELRAAADGLFLALTAWRTVANHLELASHAASESARVRDCLPVILTAQEVVGDSARWQADPREMRAVMWTAVRRLVALPAETPTLRLLCDRTAEGLLALRRALGGLVLLRHPWVVGMPRRSGSLRVPDKLPALINAVRAFLTIGAAALVWYWTAWPGGTTFIVFATISITMFAPQEDAAYANSMTFTIGTAFSAVCAAIANFALLPQQSTFAGLCSVLALVLVPIGGLSSRPWHPLFFFALAVNFIALLRPSNPQAYDPAQFYNAAVPLFGGIAFAMLAMRLLPPIPPTVRVRRLLALTLRDMRRLTQGTLPRNSTGWEERIFVRLSALPDSVDPLQSARMMAALSLGNEIIRLRRIAHRFNLGAQLRPALTAIAAGDSSAAIRELDQLDLALAGLSTGRPGIALRLRARGTIRSIADLLTRHASYFDTEVRA